VFLLVSPALAQRKDILGVGLVDSAATKAGYERATDTTLAETIGVAVKGALSMVGVVFLVLMVYAGYLWMTARGEEETIKKAQKIIISSIIGLVIVLASYSITNFVVLAILSRTASGSV